MEERVEGEDVFLSAAAGLLDGLTPHLQPLRNCRGTEGLSLQPEPPAPTRAVPHPPTLPQEAAPAGGTPPATAPMPTEKEDLESLD